MHYSKKTTLTIKNKRFNECLHHLLILLCKYNVNINIDLIFFFFLGKNFFKKITSHYNNRNVSCNIRSCLLKM